MVARLATSVVLVGTCAVVWLDARAACACSQSIAPPLVRPLEAAMLVDGVPANSLFYRDVDSPPEAAIESGAGPPPMFEIDAVWSMHGNRGRDPIVEPPVTAFRLVNPQTYIGEVLQWECGESVVELCSADLGELDVDPPSRPVISAVDVTIYRTRGEVAFGCGNADTMEFDVDVADDTTSRDDLYLLGYMGDDEDELAAESEPEIMLGRLDDSVSIFLGSGGRHDRDGEHFRKGRYCFAVSAVDLAGNESERSDPVCLDTTDTDDPLVHYGCGCTQRDGSTSGVLGLIVLVVARRRRGLRRST